MIARTPSAALTVPIVVIIPARNEAGTVGAVVRDVRQHVGWGVVVVDDASVDATAEEAAKEGARVLRMPFRVGAWGAVQAGMSYALSKGCRVSMTMDADGQHRAESLLRVCAPVLKESSDIAIGICPERVSGARHAAWSMFKRITGLKLKDVTSGLRAYNAEAMRILTSRDATMLSYQDIGVLLMLRDAGLRAAEIKVRMRPRMNGHSRVYDSWWTVARYFTETLILSAGKWQPHWHLDDMFVTSGGSGRK